MSANPSTPATRLDEAMAATKTTSADIANAIGMDPRRIRRLRTGETRMLCGDAAALARALGVRAAWLSVGDGSAR